MITELVGLPNLIAGIALFRIKLARISNQASDLVVHQAHHTTQLLREMILFILR